MTEEIKFKLSSEDSSILSKVFGPVNANINQIQDSLGIKVKSRGNSFSLVGKTEAIKAGKEVIETLHLKAEKSELITPGEVHLFIRKAQSTADKVDSGNLLKPKEKDIFAKSLQIKTPKLVISNFSQTRS